MNKDKFKILSIDGGGIRGVIPARILQEIETKTGKPIHKLFDLVAGTSTGAILALGLTAPSDKDYPFGKYNTTQMLEFYEYYRYTIFQKRFFHRFQSIFSVSYEGDDLYNILKTKFSDIELRDVLTNVLITAYDAEEQSPFIFKKRLAKLVDANNKNELIENPLLCKLARATSAAPTFFEPYLDNKSEWLDGGVFANNPSLLAFIEAIEIKKQNDEIIEKLKKDYVNESNKGIKTNIIADDSNLPFFMLSLGTGKLTVNNNKGFFAKIWKKITSDGGKIFWATSIVDVLMQGVSDTTHYEMRHLLPYYSDGITPRYLRINPDLKNKKLSEMDNADNYTSLVKVAEKYIKDNPVEIELICTILES
jgi:uncharacterized protein